MYWYDHMGSKNTAPFLLNNRGIVGFTLDLSTMQLVEVDI
jgi:hypothetical protein